MAWPNTPLTTYLSGGLPFIKAFDLNAFQSAINGIINATYSLKAVEIDGTGGAIVVPVAGTAKLSATASGAAAAMTAVAWGRMYKEAAVFGFCRIDGAGTSVGGYNIKAIPGAVGGADHPVAGEYYVTFNGAPTNTGRCVPVASLLDGVAVAGRIFINPPFLSGADLKVQILTYDAAGAQADVGFSLAMFGG